MYTAPVKFPTQAWHVTEEAVVEVDLPAQMVRAISDLGPLVGSSLISHLCGQISCERTSAPSSLWGAAVSTHFTGLSVLEGGLLQYQLLATL